MVGSKNPRKSHRVSVSLAEPVHKNLHGPKTELLPDNKVKIPTVATWNTVCWISQAYPKSVEC